MHIRWYGQSTFLLTGDRSVFIDPFGDMAEALVSRGLEFRYAPIVNARADLLLVTHEHRDHNAVEVVGGEPVVIRSTAGRFESPAGEVVAIASEHDDFAGTQRGPNTIFCFELDGLHCCHLGDFGQAGLRAQQRAAIGKVDVLFVPAGGGPTIGGEPAAALVRDIAPRLVVPMHYRTPAVNFLDPPDEFLVALGVDATRLETSELDVDGIIGTTEAPTVVLFAPPVATT
jgi:L-ascorbate metabolism protein UlaG (beta-lactamase superfamily)